MAANSDLRTLPPYQRLIEHLRTPLYLNGYFLTLSSLATSGIGLVYWVLAAHRYSAYIVGLNSAVIAAMTFLAGVSELNLMSALIRFIPTAGRSTRRFVLLTYLVSLVISALISVIFLAKLDFWSPALDFLGDNRVLEVWFTLSTMAWCIFVLQDSVLTGLRQASWVPLENTIFSLAKIILMIIFAVSLPALGIYASWSFSLVVAIIPTNFLIFHRLIPAHEKNSTQVEQAIHPRQIIRFATADYLGAVSWIIATTLMPIIVTSIAGATANAYFFLAWTIANTLYLISTSMGSSLVVEAAKDQAKLSFYSYKVYKNTMKIVVPASLLLAAGAPYILLIFGKGYSQAGTALLRLLVLSAIPNVFNTIFVSVSRVQRRTGLVGIVLGSLCASLTGLSYIFLKMFGIVGVGYAWIISQTIVAAIIYATRLRHLWKNTREFQTQKNIARIPASKTIALPTNLYRHVSAMRIYPYIKGTFQIWSSYQKQSRAKNLLPEIIKELPEEMYTSKDGRWIVHSIAKNGTNTTVAFLGPAHSEPCAVIKLPASEKEAQSLRQQSNNLLLLNQMTHLGEWRQLLPRVISSGVIKEQAYFIENVLPGALMVDLMNDSESRHDLIRLAAAEINTLHRKTCQDILVDMNLLDSWIFAPLNNLAQLTSRGLIPGIHQISINRLYWELQSALLGRRVCVSWIHGDYFPTNILVSADRSRITGIMDWDLARSNELPWLDLIHFLVSIRMITDHCEMGQVVSSLILDEGWKPHELEIIRSAESGLPGSAIDLRMLLLLTWLRHINANLNKTTRFDHHNRWITDNIVAVLQALDVEAKDI